jgi:hypothetical protein
MNELVKGVAFETTLIFLDLFPSLFDRRNYNFLGYSQTLDQVVNRVEKCLRFQCKRKLEHVCVYVCVCVCDNICPLELLTITIGNEVVLLPDRLSIVESEHCECADSHLLQYPADHTAATLHGLFATSTSTRSFASSATAGTGHPNCGAEPQPISTTTTLQASELD